MAWVISQRQDSDGVVRAFKLVSRISPHADTKNSEYFGGQQLWSLGFQLIATEFRALEFLSSDSFDTWHSEGSWEGLALVNHESMIHKGMLLGGSEFRRDMSTNFTMKIVQL